MEAGAAHFPYPSGLEPCPYLPAAAADLTAACLEPAGRERGAAFYRLALAYAQSLWLQGFPARALLLINRAMGCAVNAHDSVLDAHPLPYQAAAWLLVHHRERQFIGNPRRHWQHLATRMVEPRRELRTWRAWACWHLACTAMPEMPGDAIQISREGVREPNPAEIHTNLVRLGLPGEVSLWQAALDICRSR